MKFFSLPCVLSLLAGFFTGTAFILTIAIAAGIKTTSIEPVLEIAGSGFAIGLTTGCLVSFMTIIITNEVKNEL